MDTELERRLHELRQDKHYLESILSHIYDDVIVVDKDYRIIDVNKAVLSTTGHKREQIIGRHSYEIFHGYDDPCEKHGEHCALREAFQTGRSSYSRHQHIHADGSKVWVDIFFTPLRDENGNVTQFVKIVRDVSDHVKTEGVLRESEGNFRALAENANDGIMVVIGKGVHVYANKRAGEISGYSASELRKITIKDWAHPDEFKKIIKKYRAIVDGKPYQRRYETTLIRKDGKAVPLEVVSARTKWHGEYAYLVIFRDISEKKQTEEALKKAHTELERRVQERTADLAKKTEQLKEANTALKVLLKQREDDKIELQENVLANFQQLVLPYLEELKKSQLDAHRAAIVSALESNLNDITAPFAKRLSSKYSNLTPAEIKIANLIRDGRTTKEIAVLLHLSEHTIKSHRSNIRRKLRLKNKQANLRSHLSSLQE